MSDKEIGDDAETLLEIIENLQKSRIEGTLFIHEENCAIYSQETEQIDPFLCDCQVREVQIEQPRPAIKLDG